MLAGAKDPGILPRETIWSCPGHTRIRQSVFGRIASRSQLFPFDHAPAGAGFSDKGSNHRRRYQNKWQYLSIRWFVLLALLAPCCGCRSRSQPAPQDAYQQARLTLVRGDLVKAEQQAKEGYDRYSPQGREWAWKFRILEAEI